ncbi:MAG: HDOD domain-containing protein [Chromatiaceae bacterium]|nr:HDOD domain-containing protein [Chromatiaceae bacterium]
MKGSNPRLPQITLPIMSRTARELRRLLDMPHTRHRQLHDVLLTDPAASIAVFRELGRARPGAGEQVADTGHAVSLLGMEPFRRLVQTLPEVDSTRPTPTPTAATAYSEAAHAAFYAGAISDHKGLARLGEITTAALLQNPAVLALWATEPESALRAANAVRDGVPSEVAFGAELGEPLSDVNRRLAEAWALPGLARQSMAEFDDFNPRPQAVRLADEIAQSTAVGWHNEQTGLVTRALSDFLDLSHDGACTWLHRQAIDAARTFSRHDYPLPGFQLLLMPGEVDEDDDEDIPIMGQVRRRTSAAQAGSGPATPSLHETMAGVMRRIRSEAGAARVVFAMLNKDRSRLRTRLALGGEAEDDIRRLDIDLAEKTLFSIMLGKPQSLWLNRDNVAKYESYLPATLRRMLAAQGAYLMSLFVGDRPLGLMYGDGGDTSENGYRRFRVLCQEATAALSAGSRLVDRKAG